MVEKLRPARSAPPLAQVSFGLHKPLQRPGNGSFSPLSPMARQRCNEADGESTPLNVGLLEGMYGNNSTWNCTTWTTAPTVP
ncbi:MAG: hypothetical protein R2838_07165 [Caldilineaceae bacterium]